MNAQNSPVYLRTYLAPLACFLQRTDVTDVFINRPGELWVETLSGAIERHPVAELEETTLWRLARQIASVSHQGISPEHPLLSATLPGGERVQIIAPPATRGTLVFALRKHVVANLSLQDFDREGAFCRTYTGRGISDEESMNAELRALLDTGRTIEFIRLAVRSRKNIVISGGTSTGKTTLLNALLKEIPDQERLILIEDAPEVQISNENAIGLIAARGDTGEAQVTSDDLVQASLRLRPDRIILGELRGREAASFLRAVNTGHPGSITTLHADSPDGAVDQLSLLVLQAGLNLRRSEIREYVRGIVDIFIQVSRREGRRVVSQVHFSPRISCSTHCSAA
ncbi:MAG TPA: P-type DNA transfer ATPase VirB11 [Micropepsaceae bacterium]|nr:P-type DNA transfer ATPase VirB11 [Micropepsaceae bacterium]